MSEEDLELLITLDDPGEAQEEDAINHLQVENTIIDNGPYPVVFGQGDWTCAVSRLTGTMNDSMRGLNGNMIQPTNQKIEIEVCTVTCAKNGEIVEQKVFYELVGMQKQFGVR
jgi:SnoaL-like polyketide cyclase.